jgi:hypothetical protein
MAAAKNLQVYVFYNKMLTFRSANDVESLYITRDVFTVRWDEKFTSLLTFHSPDFPRRFLSMSKKLKCMARSLLSTVGEAVRAFFMGVCAAQFRFIARFAREV